MSEPLYNIVFFGTIQEGKDKAVVMQNMAKLFKTEPAKLTSFFTGDRKVIKSNVNEQAARKYHAALKNAGLVIKVEAAGAAKAASPKGAAKPATKATSKPAAQTASTADTSGITMAEVGALVIENPVEVTPQEIGDISDISMAEVGANVVENPVEVTPQAIADIGDISMAEAGADIIENPKEKKKAPIPDISELSLD